MSRITHLMNTALEVWRTTRAADGMGGWETAESLVGTARCRISQPSATERTLAAQSTARLTHVIYAEADANIRREDLLRQGAREFRVVDTFEPSVPGTYLRVNCEEVQTDGS